jgi:hypothetical protein
MAAPQLGVERERPSTHQFNYNPELRFVEVFNCVTIRFQRSEDG